MAEEQVLRSSDGTQADAPGARVIDLAPPTGRVAAETAPQEITAAADDGWKQQQRFEALRVLRDAVWQSYDRRRGFEWKMSFGLWTALAAVLGVLLTKDVASLDLAAKIGSGLVGTLLCGVHVWWMRGVAQANRLELDKVYMLEDRMREVLGVAWPSEIADRIASMKTRNGLERHWSYVCQGSITLILTVGAVLLLWSRG